MLKRFDSGVYAKSVADGKPLKLVTRDGIYDVIHLHENKKGGEEARLMFIGKHRELETLIAIYTGMTGHYWNDKESGLDVMMEVEPEQRKFWLNIYRSPQGGFDCGNLYPSRDLAVQSIDEDDSDNDCFTVEINLEINK